MPCACARAGDVATGGTARHGTAGWHHPPPWTLAQQSTPHHTGTTAKELAIGLAVFCAMPTTLSSGAVLVDQSNGNFTLALLLTAGTNVMGIFTIPFMLKLYLSTGTDVEISPVPMLIKLCITILLPLCLGKALRQIQPLVDFRLR
jgi:predicted Na+-dependent transporter